MAIDIGRAAYSKWVSFLEEKGRGPFSSWESLGQELQDAWRHAAVAALHANDSYNNIDEGDV